MKKRNKYFLREKAIIRLKIEDQKNHDAIRNQGWVELDKPIHHGYYAEWVLRSDILNREDAHVYQEVLDACAERVWSKNEEFKYKDYKTKKWVFYNPRLIKINKEKYEKLSPSARKHFVEDLTPNKNWRYGYSNKQYHCTLSYELIVLKSKAYITHRREHDNVLKQIESEIKKDLYRVSNGNPWGGYGDGKFWRKQEHKKLKMVAERELRQELRENL
jgi:hypothetical protein